MTEIILECTVKRLDRAALPIEYSISFLEKEGGESDYYAPYIRELIARLESHLSELESGELEARHISVNRAADGIENGIDTE